MKTFADYGIHVADKTGIEVKVTCPQCSHTRRKSSYPCLSVNTDKGVWHCWHCDWSGSLTRGEEQRSVPPKFYRPPVFTPCRLPQNVLDWFAGRGIPPEILQRNRIGYGPVYMPQVEEEVNAIQFPYFREGAVVNIKYRDGRKHFRMAGGAERILYGLDDIQGDTLLICEGELDKLALEVAGYTSVVSVPDGAPAADSKNYAHKFDFLASAESQLAALQRIILAVDNDAPGQRLAEELARRLGPERCYTVQWSADCKDANDVLMHHKAHILKECIDHAQPWPIHGVRHVADVSPLIDSLYQSGLQRGLSTGWRGVDAYYTVRPGEFTIVTGIPGHGKSQWLSALAVNMARLHGWRFAIFSPENYPLERYCAALIALYVGQPFGGHPYRLSVEQLQAAKEWLGQHLSFLLPEDESPTIDWLLGLARVQVYREGIQGLILDPWNEIEHSRPANLTETEYISQTLSKVRRFARLHHVHVWIVAHPTKLTKATSGEYAGQYPPPTPYDISGSAHWRNKADNCLTIWRDVDADDDVTSVYAQKIRYREIGRLGQAALRFVPLCGRYEDVPALPGV